MKSPGKFCAQNLVDRSFDDVTMRWPSGCHATSVTALSWAWVICACGSAAPATQCAADPSRLAVVNTDSIVGCHASAVSSLEWPRQTEKGRRVRISHTLAVVSRDAVANQRPLSFHRTLLTPDVCPVSVATQALERGSHSFTVWSLDPDSNNP